MKTATHPTLGRTSNLNDHLEEASSYSLGCGGSYGVSLYAARLPPALQVRLLLPLDDRRSTLQCSPFPAPPLPMVQPRKRWILCSFPWLHSGPIPGWLLGSQADWKLASCRSCHRALDAGRRGAPGLPHNSNCGLPIFFILLTREKIDEWACRRLVVTTLVVSLQSESGTTEVVTTICSHVPPSKGNTLFVLNTHESTGSNRGRISQTLRAPQQSWGFT